jgi:RNA polymerase sigma-70 factor (ECF subfamily)
MKSAADRRFDELYEQHFRHVLAYCLRRSPAADGYDAANEVFAIAWRRIEDIPAGEAARPWLYVVARRVLYRRWRSVRRFRRLTERAGALAVRGLPDPEAVVVQRAEYEAVVEAATQLSSSDQEVLRLAAWEGLSHREIAQVVGCSIAAVDQRLHRAKKRLAKRYEAAYRPAALSRAAGGEEA